jgi:DNA-binding MarR family transcriptional regulator
MVNVKYQIFVSATYEDLKQERQQAIKAILEMGHVPVGMEMFSAADEEQWKIIQRTIDECDYYVIICAHRYGSVELTSGISYTEREYDYAAKQKVPILGFVIEPDATWPAKFVDADAKSKTALEAFKAKIKSKYISYWSSSDDLYGKVAIALMKQFTTVPRIGWVRANQTAGPDTVQELGRLSKENAALRARLDERAAEAIKAEEEDVEKILAILNNNKELIGFWYKESKNWEDQKSVSLGSIFNLLAPDMIAERSFSDMLKFVAFMQAGDKRSKLRETFPIPRNTMKRIIADLAALDLVEPSSKKHLAADKEEYWSLSEKGREVLRHLRRKRLEAGLSAAEQVPSEDPKK